MNYHSILLASSLLTGSALLSGCTTTNTTDVTSVQPVSTGTMIGRVYLLEMDGTASASSAGATVGILGTTHKALTDSTGRFVLDSIPAGYYNLQFSKPGFTESITSPQPFVGADTMWGAANAVLYRINNWKTTLSQPTMTVENFENYGPGDTLVDTLFYLETAPGTPNATVLDSSGKNLVTSSFSPTLALFIGRNPNINYLDSSTYSSWTYTTVSISATYWLLNFSSNQILSDTLYVIAYPISGETPFFQYIYNGVEETTFTGFGPPSNVVKVVLP